MAARPVGEGGWNSDTSSGSLSDGFISTLALCIDIFIRLERLPAKQRSPVVVLVDEVSGFLHPRWQVAFLPMLRGLFPMAQFILTTHSPFVLASSPEGKLFAIERTHNESSVVDRSGDPLRLTIEQIISVFGISRKAPRMAALEREFEECSGRIAAGEAQPTDRARLRELTQRLAEVDPVFRVLSESDRPSMALLDRLRRAIQR
jgi:predicted ATP-binding protein involved in virulence